MGKENPPYIGICDFANAQRVHWTANHFTMLKEKYKIPHVLMVGVMSSYKVLNGEKSKWSKIWPPTSCLKEIFVRERNTLNTLHYADYEYGRQLYISLKKLAVACGPHLHAIQLDMTWPDANDLRVFRDEFDDVRIVLQVGKKALDQLENNVDSVVSMLADYTDCVDYVLLDMSLGKGVPIEPLKLIPYIMAIKQNFDFNIAVAGGLDHLSVPNIKPLIELVPNLSMDAQSRLHFDHDHSKPINWPYAHFYLQEATKLFERK